MADETMVITEPIVIEPTTMKSSGDCALCCLKMLLGVSYPEVVAAVPKKMQKDVHGTGLTVQQMINVGRKLGFTLIYHDLPEEDEIGILVLTRSDEDHVVMYLKGIVYNPADNELWTDDDAFLVRGGWTVDGFLWRKQ
jgi:hypothetical protein